MYICMISHCQCVSSSHSQHLLFLDCYFFCCCCFNFISVVIIFVSSPDEWIIENRFSYCCCCCCCSNAARNRVHKFVNKAQSIFIQALSPEVLNCIKCTELCSSSSSNSSRYSNSNEWLSENEKGKRAKSENESEWLNSNNI